MDEQQLAELEMHLAAGTDLPTAMAALPGDQQPEQQTKPGRAFGWARFEPGDRKTFVGKVEQDLRPAMYRDGQWTADYRRLRVVAIATSG